VRIPGSDNTAKRTTRLHQHDTHSAVRIPQRTIRRQQHGTHGAV